MSTAEQIMREIQKLPELLAREVLDFIGYIELKHGLKDRLAGDLSPLKLRPWTMSGSIPRMRFGMTCSVYDLVLIPFPSTLI